MSNKKHVAAFESYFVNTGIYKNNNDSLAKVPASESGLDVKYHYSITQEVFKGFCAADMQNKHISCQGFYSWSASEMKDEIKKYIDANVWDGKYPSSFSNRKVEFDADSLQEFVEDCFEHVNAEMLAKIDNLRQLIRSLTIQIEKEESDKAALLIMCDDVFEDLGCE